MSSETCFTMAVTLVAFPTSSCHGKPMCKGNVPCSVLRRSTNSLAASKLIPFGRSAASELPPCPRFCTLVGHSQRVWRERFFRRARHWGH
jgi:hypothetical protein